MTRETRLSPEQLLQQVQEEEHKKSHGKLKIYLGAAPGVGKTYRMLSDANADRTKGIDVVIGVVESHGRKEIESMLKDFEILPKQTVDYRGKELKEFDLDLALRRNPSLILIDEMAHTNAPNLRHPKRWQDIKELLDRKIDVYTTLNIQHIESLKDDIAQIIQAPIKETVPDSIIDMADTIELIDIPPEELQQRLREGKVYIPQQTDIAIGNFFRKGNLIALRELALRITAKFVGAQVYLYRQGRKITRIWPTKDRILVCVGPGIESPKLIRAARRLAANLKSEWMAVYVDSPKVNSPEQKRNDAIRNLIFAQQLGAETRILSGLDIVKTVMNFAREQNITLIMIWKHIRFHLRDLFFKNLVDEIVRHSGEINIYIMTGELDETQAKPYFSGNVKPSLIITWKNYFLSIAIVASVTLLNFLLFSKFDSNIVLTIYLLGVSLIGMLGQKGPALLGVLLSVLLYRFLFISPAYSLDILNIESIIMFIMMLMVSLVICHLSIIIYRLGIIARHAEHRSSALYRLSRELARTRGKNKLLDVGTHYLAKMFNSTVIALMPENNHLEISSKTKSKEVLNENEMNIAQWAYDVGQMAGFGTDTLPLSDALYIPLRGAQTVLGVLKIKPKNPELLIEPEQIRLLETCTNQIALALEVDRVQEQSAKLTLQEEIDRVRNALLQSISHDLLQIAYLETDTIRLDKKFCSINDLILHVLKKSKKKLDARPITIDIPEDLPNILIDKKLIEDVFINLIDNAIKYTPLLSPIEISAVLVRDKDSILVSVMDHGPGIVQEEVDKLFEKYYRGILTAERGLGLGLSICQKIIETHGGTIWAENRKQGGAAFYFTLGPIQKRLSETIVTND